MKKFITLLKYLDQSKVTPEAVMEIAAVLGRSPTMEQAAEVAEAFRTRGANGLLTLIPGMLQWTKTSCESGDESSFSLCPNCGTLHGV